VEVMVAIIATVAIDHHIEVELIIAIVILLIIVVAAAVIHHHHHQRVMIQRQWESAVVALLSSV